MRPTKSEMATLYIVLVKEVICWLPTKSHLSQGSDQWGQTRILSHHFFIQLTRLPLFAYHEPVNTYMKSSFIYVYTYTGLRYVYSNFTKIYICICLVVVWHRLSNTCHSELTYSMNLQSSFLVNENEKSDKHHSILIFPIQNVVWWNQCSNYGVWVTRMCQQNRP